MSMMKRLLVAAMVASLAFVLFGCGGSQPASESSASDSGDAPIAGGWTINTEADTAVAGHYEKIFTEATSELDGMDYEPVAVLGQQVVAGMNYAYLCKMSPVVADPETNWGVVVVYEDLDGKAKFVSAKEIDLADVKVLDKAPETLAGGWGGFETPVGMALPGDADKAFQDALDKQDDSKLMLQSLALLGTQVVSGTNYLVMCAASDPTDASSPGDAYVAVVYKDASGSSEITDLNPLDLAYYATPEEESGEEASAGIANPWTDAADAAAAAKGAGFDGFDVPDQLPIGDSNWIGVTFKSMKGIAEADYEGGATMAHVRKGQGVSGEALHGVYDEFTEVWTANANGIEVKCNGTEKGVANLIEWSADGYSYSVYCIGTGGENYGMAEADIANVVASIK